MVLRQWVSAACAVVVLWMGGPALVAQAPAPVQTASVTLVTASYLLRFARFVEWPSEVLAPGAPLVFCATDASMVEALKAVLATETVGTHALAVLRVQPATVPKLCGVLYASGLDARRISMLAPTLKTVSLLSVGDSEDFIRAGGIIHLYKKDDRLRFTINITAAERVQLRLNSNLLSLATATVVRE